MTTMLKLIQSITVAVLLSLSVSYAQDNLRHAPNQTEPSVHDPVAIKCGDIWYLFSTGWCVDVWTSPDLKSWTPSGHVFDNPPAWALESVERYNGHTWAPDIHFHNGLYYLYYSCSSFGKNGSAIGVAVNRSLDPKSPDYCWKDSGCVVRSIPGRDDWNAIDPNLFIDDDGSGWLSFGSFWSGIKLVRLDSTLTRPAEPQEWYHICRRPEGTAEDTSETDDAIKADSRGAIFNPGNGAVEAPFIVKRGEWYYLFASYDLCCRGPKSTYNIIVGRSANVEGPYFDASGKSLYEGGGTSVLRGDSRFPGVGHCAVVDDGGRDILLFHAYDREHNYNSILLSREIKWDGGWPVVSL